jgi:hypothetical protein
VAGTDGSRISPRSPLSSLRISGFSKRELFARLNAELHPEVLPRGFISSTKSLCIGYKKGIELIGYIPHYLRSKQDSKVVDPKKDSPHLITSRLKACCLLMKTLVFQPLPWLRNPISIPKLSSCTSATNVLPQSVPCDLIPLDLLSRNR